MKGILLSFANFHRNFSKNTIIIYAQYFRFE